MLSHNPYLHFNGTCRQAMTFYAKVFQSHVNFNTTYEKMPPAGSPGSHPGKIDPNRILHCELHAGPFILMASDGPLDYDATPGKNFAISLTCSTEQELHRLFKELSENGNPHLPPHTAFWGGTFAMLTDQHQISWMLSHRN